jgi:heat shock protein HtpX
MANTFRDLIADNKRKSFWLVVGFCLFTALVGFVLSLAILVYMQEGMGTDLPWQGALATGGAVTLFSLVYSAFSFYLGDQVVLGVAGAKPLEKQDDPQLFNVVEEMAIAAGLPIPKVYLIHDSAPNAFATGRDPQHAVVAITSGLRTKLNREELQGVIAHEMAHVRNYDIRLMLLLAVLIGTIVMLADLFWRMLRFTPTSKQRSSRKDGKNQGNPLLLVLLVVAVLLALIAPFLAQIIQLAVSRQREYLADASGVELTRNPQGLASALRKIDEDPDQLKTANRGTAHLFIANPIKKYADLGGSMFASHPPMQERIKRLESLAGNWPSVEDKAVL